MSRIFFGSSERLLVTGELVRRPRPRHRRRCRARGACASTRRAPPRSPSSATTVSVRSPFSFSPMRTTPDDSASDRGALGRAGLEELDDTREAVGDVLTRDATGVERPHGELRARLTDRLGGDDADGLALVDELAGGEHRAVAGAAHAGAVLLVGLGVVALGRLRVDLVGEVARVLAREHRAHPDPGDGGVGHEHLEHLVGDLGVARDDRAVGERDVLGEAPAEQPALEQRGRARGRA